MSMFASCTNTVLEIQVVNSKSKSSNAPEVKKRLDPVSDGGMLGGARIEAEKATRRLAQSSSPHPICKLRSANRWKKAAVRDVVPRALRRKGLSGAVKQVWASFPSPNQPLFNSIRLSSLFSFLPNSLCLKTRMCKRADINRKSSQFQLEDIWSWNAQQKGHPTPPRSPRLHVTTALCRSPARPCLAKAPLWPAALIGACLSCLGKACGA